MDSSPQKRRDVSGKTDEKPRDATSTVRLHELLNETENSKENQTSARDGGGGRGSDGGEERDRVKVDQDVDGMIN